VNGDFSRLTFAEKNHYRRVLMQQGRVEIDADGNEQIAIDHHIAATTATDVIGQAGYPLETLPDGTSAGGFALALNAAGTDLEISKGRMYVDGLLVENDAASATLLTQPDMPGVTLNALGVTQSGIYLVYLDVWERLVTALDDPAIRETALGGPDTSVRTKLVWQVKLASLGPAPQAGSPVPTCATAGQPWPSASTGALAAGTGQPGSDLPCILPPQNGYQRLENQLYRVQIHTPGADNTATFKWSRENGSVVSLISAPPTVGGTPPPATVTGPTFWVTSLSNDPTLGLQADDWVELTDDSSELTAGSGTLYQVAATPTDGHTVTISGGSTTTVNLSLHPKLRRWDQSGAGLGQGITVTTGAPIPLEGGVQVQFSPGTYRAGDYWLIPARTATSVQQGYVEWPVDASSNPVPQPPSGIRHHYAQLGLVEFTAPGTFGGLGTATAPTDCRLPFPPLTDLMPAQSASPCTIVAKPGAGWEQPILDYFQQARANAKAARPNAEICFPVGDFPVASPLVISGAGHIVMSGAGWGTRLIASADGPESVLVFSDCLSVAVRDLYAETSVVTSQRTSAGRSHINGTLEFSNCGDISVEEVWARCGSAVSLRGSSCITVSSDVVQPDSAGAPGNVTTGSGSVRVRDCQLYVGEMQVGIQLVHQARASVEDNVIVVDPGIPVTTLESRLADPVYLAAARGYLISQTSLAPTTGTATSAPRPARTTRAKTRQPRTPASSSPETAEMPVVTGSAIPASGAAKVAADASIAVVPVTVKVGGQVLTFVTTGNLQSTWQTYLDAHAPANLATLADALRYIKSAATTILTTPSARAGLSGFGGVVHILTEHVPLAGRGIVVGGQAIGDLQIIGNSVSGVITGITVGVSHRASAAEAKAKQRTPDQMGTVRIAGNEIACRANDVAAKNARFGVFVGSAHSLSIEDNRLTITAAGISTAPPADAIRAVGYFGGKVVIRNNYMTGFAMGIRVVQLQGNGPGTRVPATNSSYVEPMRFGSQWLVADNAIEGASKSPTIGPFWPTKPPAPLPTPYVDAPACLRVNNASL
jgi:hypothetical protein